MLDVFAEKIKQDTSKINSIQWEKIHGNKSNDLKKIIWKSYNEDESYFKNKINESYEIKKFKKDKYKYRIKPDYSITQIEPYLPLNNFLDYGDFRTSVRWKSSFDGGASLGTGQQNPSFIFDYGVSDSSLISIYFSEADDNLYNLSVINYKTKINLIFIVIFFLLIISEVTMRYAGTSFNYTVLYLSIPIIIFIVGYYLFYRLVKNV